MILHRIIFHGLMEKSVALQNTQITNKNKMLPISFLFAKKNT
jgi:hypothetical protein